MITNMMLFVFIGGLVASVTMVYIVIRGVKEAKTLGDKYGIKYANLEYCKQNKVMDEYFHSRYDAMKKKHRYRVFMWILYVFLYVLVFVSINIYNTGVF